MSPQLDLLSLAPASATFHTDSSIFGLSIPSFTGQFVLAQGTNIGTVIGILVASVIGLFVMLIGLVLLYSFFGLWIQGFLTGSGIGLLDLVGMRFRRINARTIVRSKIMSIKANLNDADLTTKALEAHYLAGGNVPQVIRALIAAKKAMIPLSFREASAIDLAGRDVLESVQTSVYPKVIDCPPRNSPVQTLNAVARDGIELQVKARVTVRANLQQLIGGATEETIIARVGEGIVTAIGSAADYKTVLENPQMISKAVLDKKLDSQTAFEIVSIDIADIDVGANIGARLQADQAEADLRIARARAENRRAAFVAAEQEMQAKIEQSRASVVEAQSEVPNAMADAFRGGRLPIMEYYKLQNVSADTEMRKSIAGQPRAVGSPSS
jgi:uncharacterized protein YqfA (UPF0365 family)